MSLFGVHREAAVGMERGARWAKRGFFALPPRVLLRIAFLLCAKAQELGDKF